MFFYYHQYYNSTSPVMKGRKWYSLEKELRPFITGTSNYYTHHGQGHTQVKVSVLYFCDTLQFIQIISMIMNNVSIKLLSAKQEWNLMIP